MRDSFLPRILCCSGFGPLVFVPALDLDVLLVELAERRDKGARQSGVRDERNVEVDRAAANRVVVAELGLRQVLRDVDYQIDLLLLDGRSACWLLALVGQWSTVACTPFASKNWAVPLVAKML